MLWDIEGFQLTVYFSNFLAITKHEYSLQLCTDSLNALVEGCWPNFDEGSHREGGGSNKCWRLLTRGGGGVWKPPKLADIICGQPLTLPSYFWLVSILPCYLVITCYYCHCYCFCYFAALLLVKFTNPHHMLFKSGPVYLVTCCLLCFHVLMSWFVFYKQSNRIWFWDQTRDKKPLFAI